MHSSVLVLTLLCVLQSAQAFPQFAKDATAKLEAVGHEAQKRQLPGIRPGFNAKAQYVSTSGQYVFVPPKAGDQRGPCPGLNALANHGYLPHNGVGTIQQFIDSTFTGFGMAVDLSGFLGVYGAVFDGDLTSYSIGFAAPVLPVIGDLLGTPQGLGGSHNKYENDASPIRGDLYTYGESFKNKVDLFEQFYNLQAGVPDDQVNYGLDLIADFRKARFDNSKATNPYFFNGPFSGAIASPAAYTFMYRFMANKSVEYPEGRLDRTSLKAFYSITGEPGSFVYTPGYERFPENWYKRAIGDEYSIPYFSVDTLEQVLKYPEFFEIGGNTGTVNSFTGFDPANLTGGVINAKNLGEGNNAMCYAFQLASQSTPDLLEGIFTNVVPAQNLLTDAFAKVTAQLQCPLLASLQYNQADMEQFPGFSKSYNGYKGI